MGNPPLPLEVQGLLPEAGTPRKQVLQYTMRDYGMVPLTLVPIPVSSNTWLQEPYCCVPCPVCVRHIQRYHNTESMRALSPSWRRSLALFSARSTWLMPWSGSGLWRQSASFLEGQIHCWAARRGVGARASSALRVKGDKRAEQSSGGCVVLQQIGFATVESVACARST